MTNRDPDVREERVVQGVRFAIDQALKHQVHTSIPGIVQSYDAATARARVRPAVDLLLRNGASMPRAVLLDVPVLIYGGGGLFVHAPLAQGDTVQLLFSERDIAAFKQTLEAGPPPSDEIMPETGAVAFAGFLPSGAVPQAGLSIQTADGVTRVTVEDGQVTIHAASIVLQGDVAISGGSLTHGGADVGSTHTHGGVTGGTGRTGGPG